MTRYLFIVMMAVLCAGVISPAHAENSDWQVSLGTGISYAPRYEGAASNQLRLIPLLDISYNKSGFFLGVARGIGFNFSEVKYFQYGIRILPGMARNQEADARLNGTGNIDYYPEGSLFFSVRMGPLSISTGIAGSDHGTHADLGGNITIPLGEKNRFRLGASSNWGDSAYNQTYFGVTPAQAAASGNVLTVYNATEGKKDSTLSASWEHNISKSWFASLRVSHKQLEGSAQLSPLTQRVSWDSTSLMFGYRF